MPDLKQIFDEINSVSSPCDTIRRKYIKQFAEYRKRNVIIYYSGWLQTPISLPEVNITDNDLNGFMTNLHELDKSKGLDLILHTPGGSIAATENIVNYLRDFFNCNIEVFIPQLAMSAGTMIACSARKIYMGKQSSLGPIDPQIYLPNIGQVAAFELLEEIERGIREVQENPVSQVFWMQIFQKYKPTDVGTCEKAIEWSKEITTQWLQDCMLQGIKNKEKKACDIIDKIISHKDTKSHSRHLPASKCKEIGLSIVDLEEDKQIQDLVLSIHHACMATLQTDRIVKLIENNVGKTFVTKYYQQS